MPQKQDAIKAIRDIGEKYNNCSNGKKCETFTLNLPSQYKLIHQPPYTLMLVFNLNPGTTIKQPGTSVKLPSNMYLVEALSVKLTGTTHFCYKDITEMAYVNGDVLKIEKQGANICITKK